MKIAFALFAKPPVEGYVKTRIGELMGNRFSVSMYSLMLKWQKENLEYLSDIKRKEEGISSFVFLTHPPNINFKKAKNLFLNSVRLPNVLFRPQSNGSLGEKMKNAFSDMLTKFDYAVIWGSDIPLIFESHFELFRNLAPACAILPAMDGGYAAIGISKKDMHPNLFDDIPWSHPATLETQLLNFSKFHRTVKLLEPLPDLDTLDDLSANINYMEIHDNPVYRTRCKELSDFLANYNLY